MKTAAKAVKLLLFLALAAVCAGLFFTLVSLISGREGDRNAAVPVETGAEIQLVTGTDPDTLLSAFGERIPLPKEERLLSGYTEEKKYGDVSCAVLTLEYENGLTVRAVRPGTGAPLIRPAGMLAEQTAEVRLEQETLALIMTEENACAACFSTETCFVCMTVQASGTDRLISLLDRLETP